VRRIYQRRIRSLDAALWDARAYLRSRLELLREDRFEHEPGEDESARSWAADELLLRMIQSCDAGPDPRGVENGERQLGKYLAENPCPELSWRRLVDEHWVRVVWNRWHVPPHMRSCPDPEQEASGQDLIRALTHLRGVARERRVFRVPHAERLAADHRLAHPATPTVDGLVASGVLARDGATVSIVAGSPVLRSCGAWIAARLWDRAEAGPTDAGRLSWWHDRMIGLWVDWFSFGEQLGRKQREHFANAAWAQILGDEDLLGWDREHDRLAAHMAANAGLGVLDLARSGVPTADMRTPVSQRRWLERTDDININQEERGEIRSLISLLFLWRVQFRTLGPWDEWIVELVEAATDRPYLIQEASHAIASDPTCAADFLLVPSAAALALDALVARTGLRGRPWDWAVRADDRRSIERSVWPTVAECAAWALHRLGPDTAAAHIAAVLERCAALAQPSAHAEPARTTEMRWRYEVVRDVLVRWPDPASADGLAFDAVGDRVVEELESLVRAAEIPIDAPAFEVLAWLAAFGADDVSPWRRRAAELVVEVYGASLSSTAKWYRDVPPDATTWVRLAKWLVENASTSWHHLLAPTDFEAYASAVERLGEGERWGAQRSFAHKVRTHLELLATLIKAWSAEVRRGEPAPEALQDALVGLVERWLPPGDPVDRPSILEAGVDMPHFFDLPRASLLVPLGEALPCLSEPRRQTLRGLLSSSLTEVRQLATLLDALTDAADKEPARERLKALPVFAGTGDIRNIQEVERSVDALLDTGDVDRAEVWLEAWAEKARERRLEGWARWEVRARQRILLERKCFAEAADARVPDWARGDPDAERANDFLRGVAMLRMDPPRCREAVEIYERLLEEQPQCAAYAVNLFAARTHELTSGREGSEVSADEVDALRDLLADGERLMQAFPAVQRETVEQTYQVNRLSVLHRLGDWPSLLATYQMLSPAVQKDGALASYAARALESSGQPSLAAALRADLGAAPRVTPIGVTAVDAAAAARAVIQQMPALAPSEQARAWWGLELPDAVVGGVVAVCKSLGALAPALAQPTNGAPHEEDRITWLFAELLRQRFLKLEWHVTTQDPGGYTDKDPASGRGGIGKVDLRICRSETVIGVAEAVLLRSFDRAALEEHYQRLFGYAAAGVPAMVVLIWCYAREPGPIWKQYMEEVVPGAAPAAHRLLPGRMSPVGPDSGVWWTATEHEHPDTGRCRVCHVLVDLSNAAMRVAARDARR
jgi:hypothetical protein